ncbi:unnamed protein product [Colias eurytheme]|nr:unnamed protein product [Colias eurytheme]
MKQLKLFDLAECLDMKPRPDPFIIQEFYDILERVINELGLQNKPERIFNLDETSYCSDPQKTKEFPGGPGLPGSHRRRLLHYQEDRSRSSTRQLLVATLVRRVHGRHPEQGGLPIVPVRGRHGVHHDIPKPIKDHAAIKMQRMLDQLPEWLNKWRLRLNPSKTQAICMGSAPNPENLAILDNEENVQHSQQTTIEVSGLRGRLTQHNAM